MKVIVIGENAKEQALAAALERTGNHQILVCPGNPGTVQFEQSMEELPTPYAPENILQTIAQVNPDYVFILDEHLIRQGWKEKIASRGWNVISPNKKDAKLIDNKPLWTKRMQESDIPVAGFTLCDNLEQALDLVKDLEGPIVLKEIAKEGRFAIPYNGDEATDLLNEWFEQGPTQIMMCDFIEGERFNLPVFVWKDRVLPLLPFVVIRGVYENEDDAQSKGMGVICDPKNRFSQEIGPQAIEKIVVPFLKELQKDGIDYSGILSGEFIWSEKGPVCVNLKAGFSETGACIESILMESDLLKAWQDLKDYKKPNMKWSKDAAVGVVLADNDYPDSISVGCPISTDEDFEGSLFLNHVKQGEKSLETNGGRVLVVATKGKTIEEAANNTRSAASHVHCPDLFFRKDIGNCEESNEDK